MNPDWLLKHFDQISEAPDAVPRLRQFILDLAVRGKLVPQDPADKAAVRLLDRIKIEKARGDGKRVNCKNEFPKTPAKAEHLFDIPPNWTWVRLHDITSYIQRGKSPKYAIGKGPRVISQKCVQWDGLHLEWAKKITPDSLNGYEPERFLRTGDLLWNSTGTGTIGRVIRIDQQGDKLVCDSHVTVVRCLLVDECFVRIWLRSDHVYGTIESRATGSTKQVELTATMANNQATPLPPLAEQHRIVAEVDKLMALCDEMEAAQKKREKRRDRLVSAALHGLENGRDGSSSRPLKKEGDLSESNRRDAAHFFFNNLARLITRPEHIQQLRQTILNLAVQGKLVQQDPNDESTSELLVELHKAKVTMEGRGSIRERKPVERVQRADLSYVIPESWELPSFDDVFVMISGVTKGRRLTGMTTIGVPYLRVANVQRGYLDLNIVKSIRIPQSELPRYRLLKGDILMTEGGDWDKLGRAAIWSGDLPDCIHQNHIFRVRSPLLDKLLPEWVVTYTNSDLGRAYFENASKQTTNLASINMTQLRACPLPLPTVAEQHRIVKKVDELMTLCTQLEARLASTISTRSRLMDAALNQALNGCVLRPISST